MPHEQSVRTLFYRHGIMNSPVMRLFFLVSSIRCSAMQRKGRTMKTPIEFDYDLWTTEDGKCMVRVKQTGEVCEVSRETMKILRNEEKKLRRSMSGVPVIGCEEEKTTLLSLDYVSYEGGEDMSPAWLADPLDFENDALFHIRLKEFKAVLTPLELSVFECCIVRDLTMRGYEEEFHVDKSKVSRAKKSIQEKYKKFF